MNRQDLEMASKPNKTDPSPVQNDVMSEDILSSFNYKESVQIYIPKWQKAAYRNLVCPCV